MNLSEDEYLTVSAISDGLYKEKGSKFIAVALPCRDVKGFEEQRLKIAKLHPKSRHVCYAYRVDDNTRRMNDDGEPKYSAGKPIYDQILSQNLYEVGIIVVRYFGGTKLGYSGLYNAYKEAARNALERNTLEIKLREQKFKLTTDFENFGKWFPILNKCNVRIWDKKFNQRATLYCAVPASTTEAVIQKIKSLWLKIDLDSVPEENRFDNQLIQLMD